MWQLGPPLRPQMAPRFFRFQHVAKDQFAHACTMTSYDSGYEDPQHQDSGAGRDLSVFDATQDPVQLVHRIRLGRTLRLYPTHPDEDICRSLQSALPVLTR